MEMPDQPQAVCLNCDRTEAQLPILAWHFQGRSLWVCSECTPHLIHHPERILARWHAQATTHSPETGG
jgi:hypothetical protein